MWGYLLVVLSVLAMFNLVAVLARLWLHTAEEIAFAFIGCLLLCGVAFGIERLPQTPEASAATPVPSHMAPTPATTPAAVPSAPIATPPPALPAPSPPEVTPPPKPPSDPRWQYPRYSIGDPEKPPAPTKDQHTVIIEQRDPRWKYSATPRPPTKSKRRSANRRRCSSSTPYPMNGRSRSVLPTLNTAMKPPALSWCA